MKRRLRRGMRVTWSVYLSTVGGVSVFYSVFTVFFFFFEKQFLISQLIRIHIVSHSNGPFSRHNNARRPRGGYSDLFFIRRLGPRIYRSPPKNIRNFKHPKNFLNTPPKIFIFLKTKKKKKKKINIEIQNFEPKNGPSLRMYENISVPPPPLPG